MKIQLPHNDAMNSNHQKTNCHLTQRINFIKNYTLRLKTLKPHTLNITSEKLYIFKYI